MRVIGKIVIALFFVMMAYNVVSPMHIVAQVHAAAATCTDGQFCNPLKYDTLWCFLIGILQAVVLILFPIIVLMMVFTGFKYVQARGNPGAISKAHQAFLWTFIGALVVLGAQALALAIKATVEEVTGNSIAAANTCSS